MSDYATPAIYYYLSRTLACFNALGHFDNDNNMISKLPEDATEDGKCVDERPDGWIWTKGGGMTSKELQEWEAEGNAYRHYPYRIQITDDHTTGDRVQWFRAEAEVWRWREQYEIKHAEFVRIIKTFSRMADIWHGLANHQDLPEAVAYARRHAAIFSRLASDARALYRRCGHPTLVGTEDWIEFVQAAINFT